MARAVDRDQIQRKRSGASIQAIQGKQLNGRSHGNERALVRVGKTATNVLTGQDDLSTWDMEELREGRKRAADGTFTGRKPTVVPKAIHDELVRRTLSKAHELLRDNLETAVEALVAIVKSEATEPKDKIKAIDIVMNRVMGKDPMKVEVSGKAKWEIALEAGVVSLDDDQVA